MANDLIVVKVGGSLYDHPALGPGLRTFLDSLGSPALLVPGGGDFADAVRKLDAIHSLGEEAAHWLALAAMNAAGAFLRSLLATDRVAICDCLAFVLADDKHPDHLPHSWQVTSDSIAARIAIVEGASRLILLKSVDVPAGLSWREAAERGWVDAHVQTVKGIDNLPVDVINFRRLLTTL